MKKLLFHFFALLLPLLLLTGCSPEGLERIAKNERIYALARQKAEKLAVAYIREKYGVEAAALGYDVDGSDIFMGYRAHPLVTVALTDGEREFLVYLALEDPELCWDNYQGEEVAALLEDYLLSRLGLEAPFASRLEFRAAGDPSPGQTQIDGKSYSVSCMLNFRYEGQSAPELLEGLGRIEYEGRWVGGQDLLTGVALPEEDWPEGLALRATLKQYRDREDYEIYSPQRFAPGAMELSIREKPALNAVLMLSRSEGKNWRSCSRFDHWETEGLRFTGQAAAPEEGLLPAPGWVEGQVSFPQAAVEWNLGGGDTRYEQAGPTVCFTQPQGPEGVEYSLLCTILPGFFARYGDPLDYGYYIPDTGEVEVRYSLPMRSGRPGTYEEGSQLIRQSLYIGSSEEEPVYFAFLRRTEG